MRNNMKRNLFLFIIWNTAYYRKQEIINDIKDNFIIRKIVEVYWSESRFAENLSRFYGKKLPQKSFKEKACGIGPFTVIIVEDETPEYEERKTSRGDIERVNIHTFDKKTLYRKWTQETKRTHSRIHGTNTVEETEHDMTLLFGMAPDDFMLNSDKITEEYHHDIVGAEGWDSLSELFYVLNHTCKYVVMRNYEKLPEDIEINEHTDIDLLTDSFEDVVLISNAKKVFKKKYRVQCLCYIQKKPAQFDFRYVGDGYYDTEWEKTILKKRQFNNGIYIPCGEDHKYMLLYHALIQKPFVAKDYQEKLSVMFSEDFWTKELLDSYMRLKGYQYTEPKDLSVYYKYNMLGVKVSLKRYLKMTIIEILSSLKRKIIGG